MDWLTLLIALLIFSKAPKTKSMVPITTYSYSIISLAVKTTLPGEDIMWLQEKVTMLKAKGIKLFTKTIKSLDEIILQWESVTLSSA
jgi:ABC-type uncharacterized transport system permease subunit